MRNINSVLINNSLKGSEELFKTLELLNKIGVIPTKKPRAKKAKMSKDDIKQDNDMGPGYSTSKDTSENDVKPPPSSSTRFQDRGSPLLAIADPNIKSIENINKAVEDKKAELKALTDRGAPESSVRQTQQELSLLNNKLDNIKDVNNYIGLGMYGLGSRISQLQNRFRPDFTVGVPTPYNPLEGLRGSGDAVESTEEEDVEDEDVDFTNQGSQDVPENLMDVDVAPQSEYIFEPEDKGAYIPEEVSSQERTNLPREVSSQERTNLPRVQAKEEEQPQVEEEEKPRAQAKPKTELQTFEKEKELNKFYGLKGSSGNKIKEDDLKTRLNVLSNFIGEKADLSTIRSIKKLSDREAELRRRIRDIVVDEYDFIDKYKSVSDKERLTVVPLDSKSNILTALSTYSQKLTGDFDRAKYKDMTQNELLVEFKNLISSV